MSLREKIEQNPTAAAIGAVVVLVIAIAVIALQSGLLGGSRGTGVREAYFLDTGTKQIFRGGISEQAPIKAPSGKEGVRAFIYTCGECADDYAGLDEAGVQGADAFIGYTQRLDPKAKKMLEKAKAAGQDLMMVEMQLSQNGYQYSDAKATKWVSQNSRAGMGVVQSVQSKCPDGAKMCIAR
ncbi:hypothetical protein JD969_02090 [Planctomycetota bacterium]|nr:hypothetical protein JD969_02090 [Planctomycetota bacterium]